MRTKVTLPNEGHAILQVEPAILMQVCSYADGTTPSIDFLRSEEGEILVLAATRGAADDMVRKGCGSALVGVHRFTIADLVIAISSDLMNQRMLVPVRQLGREALAARVTATALSNSTLTYLQPVAGFPGFARALARTLAGLRLNRVRPDALRKAPSSGPDLALLLEAYEAELQSASLADHATRVELALEALASRSGRFHGMPVLLLDVEPAGLAERDFLAALLGQASAVRTVSLGRSEASPQTALQSLQRYVLSGETVPSRPADESFAIFSASGEALECVEVARRLLAAARSGFVFDDCAILLRNPERYQPLVAEALRRARIPAFFTRGSRKPHPAGRALLALLECAQENCSAARFAEYLSLGQMPAEDGETRAPVAWERLLVDAAVIGGKDRWARRIEGLIEQNLTEYNGTDDEALRGRCARQIALLESLAGFALPLIDKLTRLPSSAPWGVWIDSLHQLASCALKNPDHIHDLLEELEPMADIGPATIADVLLVLRDRLINLRSEVEAHRYGRVFVGSIDEARGMSFRLVFVPGLNEGIFPRPAAEDPLLLAAQCVALGMERPRDDAQLFRIACACASERIVISWSRLDLLTGRERVPSFYAFEAYKAARGVEVDVRAFEAEARLATETRTGWPAPAAPSAAIDDLEFDLAYLRPAWEQRSKGAGAYLTRTNQHAVRSLRARWLRWAKPWRWPDGFVELDLHAIGILDQHRPSVRAWSASALQQYARCPYRFALRGIYGLQPPEQPEPLQRMDPATRGSIYHEVQFDLLRELKGDGLLPFTSTNLNDVFERLSVIVKRVAARYAERLAPAIPQVWASDVDRIHADLRGWVSYKAELETDWTPEFFEFAFGRRRSEEHDPASVPKAIEALPGVKLTGSVDVVERHAGGLLRVVDHKTGRAPKERVEMIGGGEHLQPLLYTLAVEQATGSKVLGGRLFYSTLRQNYKTIDIRHTDASRARVAQVMREIDTALHNGFLPAAPRKDGCRGCEYLIVCGPWEEERATQKQPSEIHELKNLRRLP